MRQASIIRGPHLLFDNGRFKTYGIEVIRQDRIAISGVQSEWIINYNTLKQDPIGYKEFLGMTNEQWSNMMKEFERLEQVTSSALNS